MAPLQPALSLAVKLRDQDMAIQRNRRAKFLVEVRGDSKTVATCNEKVDGEKAAGTVSMINQTVFILARIHQASHRRSQRDAG
jgi:hypothetical protein